MSESTNRVILCFLTGMESELGRKGIAPQVIADIIADNLVEDISKSSKPESIQLVVQELRSGSANHFIAGLLGYA